MFNFSLIRKTLDEVENKIHTLNHQIEQTKQKKEKLLRQPSAKDDVIDMLNEFIDHQAAQYQNRLAHILSRFINNPENINRSSQDLSRGSLRLLSFTGKDPGTSNDPLHDAQPNLFFLFRDQIKEGVKRSVMEMEWPESGLSITEREKQAGKLDQEIRKLEAELAEVLEAARESGLDI